MKLKHIVDIEKFMEAIDGCTSKVELVGPDIRLNLKSKIAQLVGLTNLLSYSGGEIEELEVVAYNPEDSIRLLKFAAGM